MGETPIFGLDPDQLDQLFSLGTEDEAGREGGKPESAQTDGASPPADSSGLTAALESSLEQIGQCIGPYRLVSVLG
jgi:hypothetical protein